MSRTPLHSRMQRLLQLAKLESSLQQKIGDERDRLQSLSINRRRVLEWGGGLLALGALPSCISSSPSESSTPSELPTPEGDTTIIVGGGLAGLTAAYYLSKNGMACRVYEGSDRLGGRVHTQQGFNSEGMIWERGAEFIDSSHEEILNLARELGVKLQPLKEESKGLEEAIYYFGGKIYRDRDFLSSAQSMVRVMMRDLQILQMDGETLIPTYQEQMGDAVKALDRLSLTEYLDRLKQDVDPWLLDLMRVAYVGEYGLEADQQSALNLLALFDAKGKVGPRLFSETGEVMKINGGASRLISALEEQLKTRKAPVILSHRLQAIRNRAEGLVLIFDQAGKTVEVKANRVVIALPFSIVRKIDGFEKLEMSPVKKEAIRLLGYGTSSKIGLGFQERFWRQGGPLQPRCVGTYFTDLSSQAFWDSSRLQKGRSGILSNLISGQAGQNVGPGRIQMSLGDLDTMFRGASALHDDKKLIHNWSQSPFSLGSTMCPKPGQYTSLIGSPGEAELNGRLHFAGEHCNVDFNGFMNGAVASGREIALRLMAQDA